MTLTISNDLTNGTTADASKVQQNFDDIETWANADVIIRNGNVAMTGFLTLKAASPTADSHAARKKYVDDECNSHQAAAEATAASDATTKANAAQAAAEATAAGDATTKANAAQTAAQTEVVRVVDSSPTMPTLTASFQALGLTVTVDPTKTPGVTFVTATVDATCSTTGGDLVVQLKKGGVAVGDQLIWTPNQAGARQTITRTWTFTSTAAAVAYALEAKQTGGTYVLAGAPHSDLEAVNVA